MKWFTIYWLDGSISQIFGATIEEAFTHAGYGAGAAAAIDWYDNGITETHYWDKEKKWVKYEELKIHIDQFKELNLTELIGFFNNFNHVTVEFESKDIFVIEQNWDKFYLNNETIFVKYISLSFGEYHKGTYGGDSDDEENSHHYMMANTQYFAPSDIAFAAEAAIQRAKEDPFKSINHEKTKTMEEIHKLQKVSYKE